MGKATLHKGQWLHWISGIIAVWLLLLSPTWLPKTSLEIEPQSSVSSTSATHPDRQSAIAVIGGSHGTVARITIRLHFPFGPGLPPVPAPPASFSWLSVARASGRLFPFCSPFRFLKLIFEHQIAINAP